MSWGVPILRELVTSYFGGKGFLFDDAFLFIVIFFFVLFHFLSGCSVFYGGFVIMGANIGEFHFLGGYNSFFGSYWEAQAFWRGLIFGIFVLVIFCI